MLYQAQIHDDHRAMARAVPRDFHLLTTLSVAPRGRSPGAAGDRCTVDWIDESVSRQCRCRNARDESRETPPIDALVDTHSELTWLPPISSLRQESFVAGGGLSSQRRGRRSRATSGTRSWLWKGSRPPTKLSLASRTISFSWGFEQSRGSGSSSTTWATASSRWLRSWHGRERFGGNGCRRLRPANYSTTGRVSPGRSSSRCAHQGAMPLVITRVWNSLRSNALPRAAA